MAAVLARALGGALSAATLPAAEAYVADMTDMEARARGMAWLRTAIGLGSIAGLVLGGLATRNDLHLSWRQGHFLVDSFSVPFFLASALMLLALGFAFLFLADSTPHLPEHNVGRRGRARRGLADRALRFALGLAAGGQFGLAIFESTFALYAQRRLSYGPSQVSLAFTVCALVMVVFQYVAVRFLSIVLRPLYQIVAGFLVMGAGLLTLQLMWTVPGVLLAIGFIGLGMAVVSPTLAAMISKLAGDRQGESFGLQSSAESAGQVIGPLVGGVLFSWYAQLPYLVAGFSLIGIGGLTAFRRSLSDRK